MGNMAGKGSGYKVNYAVQVNRMTPVTGYINIFVLPFPL